MSLQGNIGKGENKAKRSGRCPFAKRKMLTKGKVLTSDNCHYILTLMIESFKDRKLKRLYENGDKSKIQPDLLKRVEFILALLDAAQSLDDIAFQSLHLHPLKGDRKGFHAVTVRANWRIIFRFEEGNVFDVEMLDYH